MCLNAGPSDPMGLAISLMLERDSQEGIDQLWDALADGGTERECGWVTDRYGVAWQVVPSQWAGLVGGPDQDGARRAMQAMLTMTKLDIAALQEAYEGTGTHA